MEGHASVAATSSGRTQAWRGAIGQAEQRPVVGYGFGTESRVFIDRWSGFVGSVPEMLPFWQDMYAAGVDLVLTGHAHNYERFAPQNPSGALDNTYGIREVMRRPAQAPLGAGLLARAD